MSNKSGEYRFSASTLVVVGGLSALLGLFALFGGGALFTVLLWLLGIPLLVSGLIRENREAKARQVR